MPTANSLTSLSRNLLRPFRNASEHKPPRPRSDAAALDIRIYLLALGTFAIGTDVFVIAGILPMIARDLGVSVEVAGQMVMVYALTYALGSPILAALAAQWRRERVILLALAGFSAADLICSL